MAAQIEIDRNQYYEFMNRWRSGKYIGKKMGEVFYREFGLDKRDDRELYRKMFGKLRQTTGDEAHRIIGKLFRMV